MRLGSAHPRNAPYQAFETSDAQIIIAAGNDELWREVCEATGKLELMEDPRFTGIAQRAKNQKALAAILQEVLCTRTAREWLDEFERRGVPSGPINSFADILGDPELISNGLIQEMPVPVAGTTKTVAYPVQLNGNRVRASLPPPRLGEHSEEVLAEWLAGEPAASVASRD
jgi:crotonobetainyl-CoA:carnitine CoA-transferase CaiB-like acyl-CoA transferase